MCAERGLAISQADREWLVLFALLRNKPAGSRGALAIHQVSRDNAPARWVTTLSMGALLVLPQRYSVYQVRSGRKQPEQTTCVPGCSWQGPHPFRPHDISLIFSRSLFLLYLIPDTDHILFFVAKTTRFYSIIFTCHKSEMLLKY